jgi:hypothetical protein
VIYVGIDDTDNEDAPGTNKLARRIIGRLGPGYESVLAVRHQLLFDSRIPYTKKNSSASILFNPAGPGAIMDLAGRIRRVMLDCFVERSDPGLCVAERVPEEIIHFGRRCQNEVVDQAEARTLAARHGIHLKGLGGTEDGVIGALAAVGLVAAGNDGRVVHIGPWPDDLSGVQDARLLLARGVDEIRQLQTGRPVIDAMVDVGKRLRPNYRDSRVVLFVAPSTEQTREIAPWCAVRLT